MDWGLVARGHGASEPAADHLLIARQAYSSCDLTDASLPTRTLTNEERRERPGQHKIPHLCCLRLSRLTEPDRGPYGH